MKDSSQKIEISHKTIVFTVVFLLGLYLTYLIKDVLALLFVAILFMTAINPLVIMLEKTRIPRGLSILITYLLVIGLFVGAFAAVIPPLVKETVNLVSQIPIPPSLADDIKNLNLNLQDLNVIANQLDSIPKVLGLLGSAFGVIIVIVTLGVMSYYLLEEKKDLHKKLKWLFGNSRAEERAEKFVRDVENQIGSWVRGEFALMFIVGTMTYIGLRLLDVKFALPLALLAGLLEVLPSIGPTLAGVPAVAVAFFTSSPAMALAVLALYLLVQQLENSFIVPTVMNKAVGLSPITTIIIVLIGFRLGGFGGGAIAIPFFLVAKVLVKEFYEMRR
jgi:predicted PurR-regulated permease PerM